MSWVEAAWTVKRIQESLDLNQSLGVFIDQINELNDQIDEIKEEYGEYESIDTPAELMQEINTITNPIDGTLTIANNTLQNIQTHGQAFFDTALYENNNIKKPQNNTNEVLKNTVWFVLED